MRAIGSDLRHFVISTSKKTFGNIKAPQLYAADWGPIRNVAVKMELGASPPGHTHMRVNYLE